MNAESHNPSAMTPPSTMTLVHPLTGHLAFKVYEFQDNCPFDHIQRLNYYSLIWVQEGQGRAKADFSEYEFAAGSLFAFAPYQPFMFQVEGTLNGVVVQFHPDFFCIHKHHAEVACNGVLYNNPYQPPFVRLDGQAAATLGMAIQQMRDELQDVGLAQHELLVAYLKIILITASRIKAAEAPATPPAELVGEPFVLQNLKQYIEQHFRTKHAPSAYAELLHITPKALARLTKAHFNKTLSDLIAERIVIEAKRELYLTNKPVKEIAYALGYEDEHYFSRFFKNNTDVSPQLYRETVGFARAM